MKRVVPWLVALLLCGCGTDPFVRFADGVTECRELMPAFVEEVRLAPKVHWIMVRSGDVIAQGCGGKRTCWTGEAIATECVPRQNLEPAIRAEIDRSNKYQGPA